MRFKKKRKLPLEGTGIWYTGSAIGACHFVSGIFWSNLIVGGYFIAKGPTKFQHWL